MQVSVLAPESAPSIRPKSRPVGTAILVVLGVLLVQVLFEGWLVTRFGVRSTDADGNAIVDPAEWPKTIKSALYFVLLALTALKFTLDRAWNTLTSKADIALLVLGVVMVIAGLVGGSSPVLIGQALFVYFRGVIVFYAFRAMGPSWSITRAGDPDRADHARPSATLDAHRSVKPMLWIGGAVVAVSSLIALAQFWVREPAYTAFGWVDMKWANENRAQGLFDHPNDLGHLGGLFVLGLVSWFMTTQRVSKRWWALFALASIGVSVAQSRQSMMGVLAALALIALLRRNLWKRIIVAGVVFILISSLPVILSQENRENLAYRMGGVFNALLLPGFDFGKGKGRHRPPPEGIDREVRVLYITQGVKLFEDRPVLGFGVGQFGGIVAVKADPEWNLDSRFVEILGPEGFSMYGFEAVSVDVFWLHVLVEVGVLGLLAYLVWMWLIGKPMFQAARRRGPPGQAGQIQADGQGDPASARIYIWAAATLLFALLTAAWSPVLEDPVFPPLLFAVLGFGWVLRQREQRAASQLGGRD